MNQNIAKNRRQILHSLLDSKLAQYLLLAIELQHRLRSLLEDVVSRFDDFWIVVRTND